MLQLPVYLDNNATTPVDERVLEAMLPFFTRYFGNAASHSHSYGWEAEEAVAIAREQIAGLIDAEPAELVFTSGATESDNLALKGVFEMYSSVGNHIVTVKTEHKAVLDACRHLEGLGAAVTYLDVNPEGLVDVTALEASINEKTILVAVMYANNETGVIQPIREIAEVTRKKGVLFFSDATQALGKVPISVREDGVDLLACSAHKIYGPKGTGALYVRRKKPRVQLAAQMDGGGHENGRRSGTLNVPGIVGFGKAAELCRLELDGDAGRIEKLRDHLEAALLETAVAHVNGSRMYRLPNTSNMSFPGVDSTDLMMRLSRNVALSSGSACTSSTLSPSHVLKAMGLSDNLALSSLRFGLGRFTTDEEVDFTIQQMQEVLAEVLQKS